MGRRRARPSPSKHLDFKVLLATDPGTGDAGYAKACLAFFLQFKFRNLHFAIPSTHVCHSVVPERAHFRSALR